MVIVVALLLAGCSSSAAPPATLEVSTTEATPTQATVTPSMTTTFTPEPSLKSTQTVTQTLKPFSTEAIGDCRLPCWWDITPGVTTWDMAYKILNQMKAPSADIEVYDLSVSSKLPDGGYIGMSRDDSGIINAIGISTSYSNGVEYYDLLTEFGEPSEIYFFTYKDFQTRPPWLGKGERPANVIFYYASKGILADYEFFGKLDETTNLISVCPRPTLQRIWLRPDGTEHSQSDIHQITLGDGPIFMKIDEATSLTKHDFYLRYKDKNQTGCFETLVSLWQ